MRFGILLAGLSLSAALSLGCAGRSVLEDTLADAGTDAAPPDAGGPPVATRADKLDLLLVVDNSRNLEVAHELLGKTLPYLLDRLARPACVNGLGTVVASTPGPTDPCPVGVRDFAPITDIHVGVLSTSIGGHGADICSPLSPSYDPTQNDRAHLLTRDVANGVVPTWQSKGFLAWDPSQGMTPPGDSDLAMLGAKLDQIVRGVGTKGCGFESQLESIYRFLVDPAPYAELVIEDKAAVPTGVDDVLLQQRQDFLRPDSVVAVVLLTDENDCSTREGGQYYLVNQGNTTEGAAFRMPHARSVCATNPDDPCCVSCGQTPPAGCTPAETDPVCQGPMTVLEDPVNLRCFDQKRRFGIDFLYPVERYVEGFSSPVVSDRAGQIVQNPLFAGGRAPEMFFFEGIVGVPWQDIAIDPLSISTGLKPGSEIDWRVVLGKNGDPPADPLMIESVDPREGIHPLTGDPLAPPSAAAALSNPINGHERNIQERDDLQYACIYPLPAPKECASGTCECAENSDTNPICQTPGGAYGTVQRYARALPGTRHLQVLRGLGTQSIVASVCADEVLSPDGATFGYKPAVDALLRSVRRGLVPAETETGGE
ncbi:hypothetical protein [Polyangium aurulentum]|uniref:hypothetical protein n=1 Tax=Polyangium aurulentum TaxID=2567896 RepID=UPI0010AE3A17|nr:hypothetical protein [Polyangium aurulentum]UQA60005.1 hypothetical protein E8A73_005815 [Polyangium aurulentum]